MKRIMILVFALPLALAIAGAAMIGVTLANVGDGGDAAPQGGDGIAEAGTVTTERITVNVNSCWMQSSNVTRGAAAESGESDSATGAQPLVDWSTYIRICNFEDEVSVTTVTVAGERERSLIGENDCWSQTTHLRFELIASHGATAPRDRRGDARRLVERATEREHPVLQLQRRHHRHHGELAVAAVGPEHGAGRRDRGLSGSVRLFGGLRRGPVHRAAARGFATPRRCRASGSATCPRR